MPEYVYGIHPVEELFCSRKRPVRKVWIQKGAKNLRLKKIIGEARKRSINLCFEERSRMDRLVEGALHQGVVVLCAEKTTITLNQLLEIPAKCNEDPFFLILDHVEDPGNLGAVMRTAAAAGVHGLILPNRRTAPLGATVFKRSAGALERVPVVRVTNLARAVEELKEKGIWVVGAGADAGEHYTDVDISGPVALVIGGESGIRRLVGEKCDLMVSIPMKEGSESLNLSVAAALIMYEVMRQRKTSR
jgi:23S rRNA (guanosine2251-2'-O)-methyltransferase